MQETKSTDEPKSSKNLLIVYNKLYEMLIKMHEENLDANLHLMYPTINNLIKF